MSRLPYLPPGAIALVFCAFAAGCATVPKTASFPVNTGPSSQAVAITSAHAYTGPQGLVITGRVHLVPDLPAMAVHSVDIEIKGPDGVEIRKFTSQYFPTPRPNRKKAQDAHFTMITYDVPPAGSTITVTLTPEARLDEPGDAGQPAPENR